VGDYPRTIYNGKLPMDNDLWALPTKAKLWEITHGRWSYVLPTEFGWWVITHGLCSVCITHGLTFPTDQKSIKIYLCHYYIRI